MCVGTYFTSLQGEDHEQREYEISLGPEPRSAFSLTNPPFNDQRRSVPNSSPRVPSIELPNLSRSKRLLKPPSGLRRNSKPAIPTLQLAGPPTRMMLSCTSPRRSAMRVYLSDIELAHAESRNHGSLTFCCLSLAAAIEMKGRDL